MNKQLIIFGTRPEFIKLMPLFSEIREKGMENDFISLYTGQHDGLLKDLFRFFDFKPTVAMEYKDHQNSLGDSFVSILSGMQTKINEILLTEKMSMVIAQGDTTSTAAAALCAFFQKIPFAHIEAGLRTYDLNNPYPEEFFRKMITQSASLHFAPTEMNKATLLGEGVDAENIFVTGNTITDVIAWMKEKKGIQPILHSERDLVIITCHRRESQNERFHELVRTIQELSEQYPNYRFLWLQHASPFVRQALPEHLFNQHQNIRVTKPLDLHKMYEALATCRILITDSGGLQEEAAGFDVKTIVISDKTERKESIERGYSLHTGIDQQNIMKAFKELDQTPEIRMQNLYGDGKAAGRILKLILERS